MGLLAVASAHKAATAVLAIAVVAGGVNAATGNATTATVTKVVDGDTIDVRYDGDTHRVRLLNVNTPESVDPDKPVECLGPEASKYLAAQLPVGSEVRLESDQEEHDGYGRELAAVFVGDVLINAEIARAGFGVAMSVGPNTKFLSPVKAAQAEAHVAGRGLYSTSLGCTVPAQLSALEAAATTTVGRAPAPTAELVAFDSYAGELAAVLATGKTVTGVLAGATDAFPMVAHAAFDVVRMQTRVQTALSRLTAAEAANRRARAAEQKRLDEAAQEAARKAAEEAARKAAAEAARKAAEEAAAEAARQAAAQAASRQTSTSSRSSSGGSRTASPTASNSGSGSGSSGGSSGYTGCRSYAPGGKTWTPIDC